MFLYIYSEMYFHQRRKFWIGAPRSHGVLGDPTASSGDATAMPRRSLDALGDPTARTSAFWVFLARRAVAVRPYLSYQLFCLSQWRETSYISLYSHPFIKDLSMMYRALWDRRHEGATRISQCTRRVAPSALTYPSGPWVPPISQCTINHA